MIFGIFASFLPHLNAEMTLQEVEKSVINSCYADISNVGIVTLTSRHWHSFCCYYVPKDACFGNYTSAKDCCLKSLNHEKMGISGRPNRCLVSCDNDDPVFFLSFEVLSYTKPFFQSINHFIRLANSSFSDVLHVPLKQGSGNCLVAKLGHLLHGLVQGESVPSTPQHRGLELHRLKSRAASHAIKLMDYCYTDSPPLTDDDYWRLFHLSSHNIIYLILRGTQFGNFDGDLILRQRDKNYNSLKHWMLPRVEGGNMAWDLGSSDGTDALYLLNLAGGFEHVLAVEGGVIGARETRIRLAKFLVSGRATVLEAVVIPHAEYLTLASQMNVSKCRFRNLAGRSARHSHRISFAQQPKDDSIDLWSRAVSCVSLAATFGVPLYLKVDIEDMDEKSHQACLQDLCNVNLRPKYISLESESPQTITMLVACGYRHFKLVSQSLYSFYNHQNWAQGITTAREVPNFLLRNETTYQPLIYHYTSSGPWGEEALDWISGKKWRSAKELLKDLEILALAKSRENIEAELYFQYIYGFKSMQVDWFDIHAKQG